MKLPPLFPKLPSSSFRIIALSLAVLTAASLACNMPGVQSGVAPSAEPGMAQAEAVFAETGVSLETALAVPLDDQRPAILAQLGPPDAFSIEWQTFDDHVVRWEEWAYLDFRSRFDFVDGELVWTLDADTAPDGTIYAHAFDPLAFEPGMSMAEVRALLPDLSLTELALDEADIAGGVMLAGDQILLGFDRDRLVLVQTFILAPSDFEASGTESLSRPDAMRLEVLDD